MQKPREKMISLGASALDDWELLALVINVGVKNKSVFEISQEIAVFLRSRMEFPTINEISEKCSVGIVKSCQVLACLELSRRFLLLKSGEKVQSPNDLVPHFSFLKYERQEHFVCALLDSGGKMIRVCKLTKGLLNQSQVHPREAFANAIQDRAYAVVFAHNHPSGSLVPSAEDKVVTKRLCDAGNILGIKVWDHLIITSDGYTSLKAQGLLESDV